jgi:putative membrane protein
LPHADHASALLANERTFLAWVRTSIAVITLGFAVARFDAVLHDVAHVRGRHGVGWPVGMGIAMIVLGGVLPVLAAWRYHVVNRQIERGWVRADRPLVVLVPISSKRPAEAGDAPAIPARGSGAEALPDGVLVQHAVAIEHGVFVRIRVVQHDLGRAARHLANELDAPAESLQRVERRQLGAVEAALEHAASRIHRQAPVWVIGHGESPCCLSGGVFAPEAFAPGAYLPLRVAAVS